MCGIAGFIGSVENPKKLLSSMANAVNHRGPDDLGIWFDESTKTGLAHARLSILDLSEAGHQPMQSKSGRYFIVFNGEIYNYIEIRKKLETINHRQWRGHSDTEILLAAIEEWGLFDSLKIVQGMFALALWDRKKNILSLARDNMGEKPLYYGWVNNNLVFGSELKAIKEFPGFKNSINKDSLSLFMRLNSIPAPHTIYKDIYKVCPGCLVRFKSNHKDFENLSFWSTEEIFLQGKSSPFLGSASEAITCLEDVLSKSVAKQMQADVPLGAFLSGGIDSSSIVALMQAQSLQKINTFSIGFNSKDFNEAEHANLVAKHLGTNHFDMYVSDQDALDVVPLLPHIYDEPFADSSQIPTYLVSKIAKKNVTVALSGDAGDELFGGYNRYILSDQYYSKLRTLPLALRNLIARTILSFSEDKINSFVGALFKKHFIDVGGKLHKTANILSSTSLRNLHLKLSSQVHHPNEWILEANEHEIPLNDHNHRFDGLNDIEQMMAYDLISYLPTDILTKVDRASMAVSLETRTPFLDTDVIKFAASLPLKYKIHNGTGKWILREMLYRHIPKKLIERPKMGFSVPLAQWLRGPLKEWSHELIDAKRLHNEGYFNVDLVQKKWNEHLNGKNNWHHQLWNVLIFQSWLDKN